MARPQQPYPAQGLLPEKPSGTGDQAVTLIDFPASKKPFILNDLLRSELFDRGPTADQGGDFGASRFVGWFRCTDYLQSRR